jgi:prepilin-type N-terminal cleavage/methylation domain-containing protein
MPQRARGFTLTELLIAVVMTAVIGSVAVPFFIKETKSVGATMGMLDAQQSVAFALNSLDHDLRVAGVGTGTNQPVMVEAQPRELAFNANLATADSTDTLGLLTAAYYDPSLGAALTTSLDSTQAISLPLSPLYSGSTTYPTLDYYASAGLKASAQTIVFYFARDTSVGALANTYALWRKVNTAAATMLARGLDTSSTFQYFVPTPYFSAADTNHLDSLVPSGWNGFPWTFSYAAGNTKTTADTMLAAISQVSVQLKAVSQDRIGKKHFRSVSEMVPLLNAGMAHISQCNGGPVAPTSVSATAKPTGDSVHIHWARSTDETGGAKDIQEYVIFRRTQPSTIWNAVLSVPVGASDTSAVDRGLLGSGTKYDYAVAAEDCSPSFSSITTTTITSVKPLP